MKFFQFFLFIYKLYFNLIFFLIPFKKRRFWCTRNKLIEFLFDFFLISLVLESDLMINSKFYNSFLVHLNTTLYKVKEKFKLPITSISLLFDLVALEGSILARLKLVLSILLLVASSAAAATFSSSHWLLLFSALSVLSLCSGL